MKRTTTLALLTAGILVAGGLALYASDSEETPSPLFKQYCAKCHGEDGKAQTPKGKQLKAQDFTDADWQSHRDDKDLIKSVTEGGEDMPAFGKKLSADQIESLVKKDVRAFAKKS